MAVRTFGHCVTGSLDLIGIVAICLIYIPLSASSSVPEAAVFRHYNKERPISYGIQLPEGRAPFAFGHVLAEDLMSYLQEDPHGPFLNQSVPLVKWGFEEDTINEELESIWKADWHATAFWGTSKIFVPRVDKFLPSRQPPLRILAFLEAFRQVSGRAWSRILDGLQSLSRSDEELELKEIVRIFCKSLREQSHFCGVEAQIWQGGQLVMDSHTDGATSLLHLSLTLGGHRTLRIGHFKERHSPYRPQDNRRRGRPPGDEVSVWNEAAYAQDELWDIPQSTGSVYLTSPFCFEHGVRYEGDAPVFALQCRFAFANFSEAQLVNGQRTGNMRRVAEVVSDALVTAVDKIELRLPTLEEHFA
ncbi:unnamed protein product [Durusdinium trenchii]|uniref:Fe2OG dioxygenase domain-containing protein n=1 Tax=Durusdinium trenchii TaxID=1381693 RepID=A0ABP0SDL3_9DINO